jgi:hypothetical protein
MGWGYVSELRPPMGLLFIPQVIHECGGPRWNDIDTWNKRSRRKTCPSATLSTTNPTGNDPCANPGLRNERPATNRLSHGTASHSISVKKTVGTLMKLCRPSLQISGKVSHILVTVLQAEKSDRKLEWKQCTETKDCSLSMAYYVHVFIYNAVKHVYVLTLRSYHH